MLQAEQPTDRSAWSGSTSPGPTPTARPRLRRRRRSCWTRSSRSPTRRYLTGGSDGTALTPEHLNGEKSDPDDANKAATGLAALGEIDDIAIVAMPDSVRFGTDAERKTAVDHLIAHCEELRLPDRRSSTRRRTSSISGVRAFRSPVRHEVRARSTTRGWRSSTRPPSTDPGAAPATLQLPPSGFAAGIYARSDIARGVHKAPANEVVLGITRFVQNVTYDRQSVLNPEGINALRFFPGRSNRVWGARTMSSDPEWKYVNVRRLFIYLEHSIDKSTQWAVFEPNNERLWATIRQTIADFLLVHLADRRADGHQARGGVLRPLRPHHDDAERPRQRPADLPDRRRADVPGRVRHLPDRPVDGRRAAELTAAADPTEEAPMATRDNPYGAFNFMVRLGTLGGEDQIVGGFSDVSGLGNEVKYSEYRNGNDKENHVRKVANTNTTDDVTLKRGVIGDVRLFSWLKSRYL